MTPEAKQTVASRVQDVKNTPGELVDSVFRVAVAVAEIADLNDRRSTVLGISAIGNDGKHVLSVLEKTVGKLRMHPEAQLVNHEIELFRM